MPFPLLHLFGVLNGHVPFSCEKQQAIYLQKRKSDVNVGPIEHHKLMPFRDWHSCVALGLSHMSSFPAFVAACDIERARPRLLHETSVPPPAEI